MLASIAIHRYILLWCEDYMKYYLLLYIIYYLIYILVLTTAEGSLSVNIN